jgi:hypothetical protein
VGILLLFPLLTSPGQTLAYIFSLLFADLLVMVLFGRLILDRAILKPLDGLVEDVRSIASGEYGHRVGSLGPRELQEVADSVNAMAERLIRDQETLAENIESLDETNRALVEARAQVVRTARLASTGTLASGVAHELGNPLGALLAYVDVLRSRGRNAVEDDGPDLELLDSVREEALRIDRIIRSLLDFARSRESEVAPKDPWPVVEKVRELLEAQGRLEGVEVGWEKEGEVPQVLMDSQRLEQVLVNLLLNALDAVEEVAEGEIRVRLTSEPGRGSRLRKRRREDPPGVNYAHRRRMALADEGVPVEPLARSRRIVVLSVEDNGPGLPADRINEIFDPFFTTKEPGKGTGLGLALSAQLVEGMAGEILARNREEGGAAFTVRLPGTDPREDPDALPTQEGAGGGASS